MEPECACSGIYRIRNIASGKLYIGSSVNVKKRLEAHRRALIRGYHVNVKLQRAWNKHGAEAFEFSLIEIVPDVMRLIEREQHWLDATSAAWVGYNITPTAGSLLGMKHSEETRQKMSSAAKGKKKSPEAVEKTRAALKGRKMTDEQKQKMRDAKLGKKRGPHSAETKAKMSAARLGIPLSKEAVQKIAEKNRGSKQSQEEKARRGKAISEAYWKRKQQQDGPA